MLFRKEHLQRQSNNGIKMRILFFLIVGFYACKTLHPKDDCLGEPSYSHKIYPEFDISISIPYGWQAPDSSSISDSKYLIRVMNLINNDSSEHIYYDVNEFPEEFEIFNNLDSMKKFVCNNTVELFKPDSMFAECFTNKNNWKTVIQTAFKRKEAFMFFGQVLSVYDTKQIYMQVHVNSDTYHGGLRKLQCLLSSYSLSD